MRGIALALWQDARQDPLRAGATFASGLRAARALHSAERRLVQDALFGMVRREQGLAELLGSREPLALWLGWWVTAHGLSPELAGSELAHPGWHGLRAAWDGLGADRPAVARLALVHSVPEPVVASVAALLGEDDAARFLAASDARAPIGLRANRARCTREALRARLAADGIDVRPVASPEAPDGLEVVGRANLEGSAAYRDGWFEVQDEASQRVVHRAYGGPGLVIDLCAGAGGKALGLAALGADVLALDVRAGALRELERRARRAGLADRVTTRVIPTDAADPWFDRLPRAPTVVVDAPCTGTGVLRRHPEHRWQLGEARIADRIAVQRGLVERGARLVQPGGRLVYATCSVLPEEDEGVVDGFLARSPGFERDGDALRTWPHRDGCDGFYAVTLRAPGDGAGGGGRW